MQNIHNQSSTHWLLESLFLVVKRPEREAGHSPSSHAKSRMGGAFVTPTIPLQNMLLRTEVTLHLPVMFIMRSLHKVHKMKA